MLPGPQGYCREGIAGDRGQESFVLILDLSIAVCISGLWMFLDSKLGDSEGKNGQVTTDSLGLQNLLSFSNQPATVLRYLLLISYARFINAYGGSDEVEYI